MTLPTTNQLDRRDPKCNIAVIVGTRGRPTLCRALKSATDQLLPGDEVIVRFDDSGDWGSTPRNLAMWQATTRWLMFLDDDDIILPGAIATVRSIVQDLQPEERVPHIFRMKFDGREIWHTKELVQCNVGTGCYVVPNFRDKLGMWTTRYEGDLDFIVDTVRRYSGQMVWREECIYHWRPNDAELSAAGC